MRRRNVTLVEVARRAGVSTATASKALNGRARVAGPTRARVLDAANDLGFSPNQSARSLITGRTSTVGMLIRDSRVERFVLPMMTGAEEALTGISLSLIVCDAQGDAARAEALLDALRHRQVDGVLVLGDNNAIHGSVSDRLDVPVVYAYGESADPSDISHVPHDHDGAVLVVDHLLANGRRRVAHVTGPRPSRAVGQRVQGVRTALRAGGLQLAAPVLYGPWSQRWGRHAVARLLTERPMIDAVTCGSDQIAAGATQALLDAGRRVPDDVAVTGFDNWVAFAEENDPPLTTVAMNLQDLGAAAARELFELIDGAQVAGGVRRHPCSLVVRSST